MDSPWEDGWLRANWHLTPELAEHAYGCGLIGFREYHSATLQSLLDRSAELLVRMVAETLTVDEALLLIERRAA